MKLIDRLEELYDRDFPSDATEENNEEYREFIEGLLRMFPRFVCVFEAAKNHMPFISPTGELAKALYAIDDESPGCEKCGHWGFDTVYSSGDPEPGYKCTKCGHVHWI